LVINIQSIHDARSEKYHITIRIFVFEDSAGYWTFAANHGVV